MKIRRFMSQVNMATALLMGASGLGLQAQVNETNPNTNTNSNIIDADKTEMNERGRANSNPTADQAKNSASDLDAMQKIRKSIVDDQALSVTAQNVKVIARDGHVTLKGIVLTAEEKNSIDSKASAVVGKENVTNEIAVKGSKI